MLGSRRWASRRFKPEKLGRFGSASRPFWLKGATVLVSFHAN
jgi:hypothetical protein